MVAKLSKINPFKKGFTITTKLLLLVMVVCLSFILITGLVILSLNQVRDLFTDVANTQMTRLVDNSRVARDLSVLFNRIDELSLSLNYQDQELTQSERELQAYISRIQQYADEGMQQQLQQISQSVNHLVSDYREISFQLQKLEDVDQVSTYLVANFETALRGWVVNHDRTLLPGQIPEIGLRQVDDHQLISVLLGVLAEYRKKRVLMTKIQAQQRYNLLSLRPGNYKTTVIPVVNDLISDFQELEGLYGDADDYRQGLMLQLQLYRQELLSLQTLSLDLKATLQNLEQQERQLLAGIAQNDARTSQTTRFLADDLDSIIASSSLTILLLAIGVMGAMVLTMMFIVRSSIKQPMTTILAGINEFRQGRLLKQINLRERDEWGTIGNALNNMANDLYVTYSELKDSEDKFYQVFENELNALLIFDKNTGRCLDANSVALELYGVGLDELTSLKIDDIELSDERGNPEASQTLASTHGWVSCFHRRRGGSLFPVEVHTGSFQRQGVNYIFKSVRDMTQQRLLQEQQQQTLALLEATLESTSEGVLAVANDGTLMNYNQRFVELFKLNDTQMNDCNGKQLLPAIVNCLKDRNDFISMIREAYKSSVSIASDVLELSDGRMFECHSHPQVLDGEIVGRVWNFRDVSEYFKIMQELRDKENRLAHLAHHDPLTGLANRLLFVDRLEQAIHKAKRHDEKLGLFFIDLDRFKSINDSLGHMVGDLLLQDFAKRLQSTIREMDTIARLGGDEFTIILDDIHSAQDAALVAEKILNTLKEPFEANEHQFYVTSSIGISLYPDDGMDAETLIRNADAAMYRSKDEGRNTYYFYTEDMTSEAFARVVMEANLRTALEQDQFDVHYQPQFDLNTGALVGAEALVRWWHPEQGFIAPDDFLANAEESGLIIDIDQWVFARVCRQIAEWLAAGMNLDALRFAVNLSGRQLKQRHLPETFARIIKESGCDPVYLELEITEGFIMHQPEISTAILREMRKLGIHLSIDDFGTGYSSLSYLKRLPINKLKIDRSFVQDVVDDPNDAAIAKSVIALGQSMNLKVVAEGVEEAQQEAFLKQEGCDMAQGYYYSRPVPASGLEKYLLNKHYLLDAAVEG